MRRAPQEMRTYHLTVVTAGRRRIFQDEAVAQLMVDNIREYRTRGKYELYAFVVMPDHAHLLLTPAPDVSFEKLVQFIKGGFSFKLKSKGVCKEGRDERRIKDLPAFEACRQYILANPVRARITTTPEEYPYSSLRCPEMIDPDPQWLCQQSQG